MKNESNIIKRIREKAYGLGFLKIGFIVPQILTKEVKFLERWISSGYCGEMKWIKHSLNKRIYPQVLYSNVKTIISTAISYYSNYEILTSPKIGRISRYAVGDDYHFIIKEKLERLLDYIKTEIKDAEGMIFIDSSPVMEKMWAQKACIGGIGKNSLLITKEAGSYVFVGEIFLNKELKENMIPFGDLCGECSECINACPTGAICKPYVVNAERCISYLTVEHKSDISDELKEKIGNWIYGCDVCQEVCPYNNSPQETPEVKLLPRKENLNIGLVELLDIDENEFKNRFNKSPIERIKFKKFRKNIKFAINNIGEII